MKLLGAILLLLLVAALCLGIQVIAMDIGRHDGLKEGFANGREYEREMWERKPKPDPKFVTIKEHVPVPIETLKIVEVPYPVIERKIEQVDKVVTETKVYQVRTGCVGGCKCTETGE